jgi:hypothetical protein
MEPIVPQIFGLLILILCACQAFDSLRSAFTGTQPEDSAPVKDPRFFSARMGALIWGLLCLVMTLARFWFLLFG